MSTTDSPTDAAWKASRRVSRLTRLAVLLALAADEAEELALVLPRPERGSLTSRRVQGIADHLTRTSLAVEQWLAEETN